MDEITVKNFLSFLSKEYNLDKQKLLLDWKGFLENDNIEKTNDDEKQSDTKDVKEEVKDSKHKCVYVYKRSPNKGKTCGSSIRKKGVSYCSKHSAYEQRELKKKKKGRR